MYRAYLHPRYERLDNLLGDLTGVDAKNAPHLVVGLLALHQVGGHFRVGALRAVLADRLTDLFVAIGGVARVEILKPRALDSEC